MHTLCVIVCIFTSLAVKPKIAKKKDQVHCTDLKAEACFRVLAISHTRITRFFWGYRIVAKKLNIAHASLGLYNRFYPKKPNNVTAAHLLSYISKKKHHPASVKLIPVSTLNVNSGGGVPKPPR